jgi:hypothetical protein
MSSRPNFAAKIVASSWIEDSTTPRLSGKGAMFDRPEGITSYGYLWCVIASVYCFPVEIFGTE